MYKRIIEHSIRKSLQFFPVVGIVGPRQVGKTTLVKAFLKELISGSEYLDLENPRDMARLTDPLLFFERNIDKCIIIDEIQRMPQLFPVLRSTIDEDRRPGRFIVLGSAAPELIRDSSESLAGRIAYEELYPLLYSEINDKVQSMEHWLKGGFPNALAAPDDELRVKWIKNFVQTYIERDLPLLGLNLDINTTRKLWYMLAHVHGNIMNMSNIAKSLEFSSTSIKKYISFLENAFLIRQLYPFSINIKKRLVKAPKVYIRDSGVLHYLLGIENVGELETNPLMGNSWEGYVIEQIIGTLHDRYEYYFYRTHEGAECDLVLVKGGKPLYAVEIKYTSSPKLSKGMLNAFEDIKALKNFIITPDKINYPLSESIQVCDLSLFIEEAGRGS